MLKGFDEVIVVAFSAQLPRLARRFAFAAVLSACHCVAPVVTISLCWVCRRFMAPDMTRAALRHFAATGTREP